MLENQQTGFLTSSNTTKHVQPQKMIDSANFVFRKKRNCTISIVKAKALISCTVTVQLICTVTVQLICAFIFAFVDCFVLMQRLVYTSILKHKSFATCIKFLLSDPKISFGDIWLTSPVLCLTYNMKIRMLLHMVAEKKSKLQGNPFFKSHRCTVPYIVCENEISNQCFSKAKRTSKAYIYMENLCLGRRLLRVSDVSKF